MKRPRFFKLRRQLQYVLLLLLMVSLIGCQSQTTPSLLPPPIIEPGGKILIVAGDQIAIHASAEGAQSYTWTLTGKGSISPDTGDVTLYTAPQEEGKTEIVSVVAHYAQGDSPTTSLEIKIAETVIVPLGETTGIPAGWMTAPGLNPADFIVLKTATSGCHTDNNCIQIEYKPGGGWAGIMWWPLTCGESGTSDAWQQATGGLCGVNIFPQKNARPARLTFWARGENGGEVSEFKVGGADVLPSPGRSTGQVTLKSNWEQIEIELTDVDLSNAAALFTWVATDAANPQGALFYLDDIQFEGMK